MMRNRRNEQDIEQEEENPQELPAMFDFAKATADIETEPDENNQNRMKKYRVCL